MIAMLLGGVVGLREIFGVIPVAINLLWGMDIVGFIRMDTVHLLAISWFVIVAI
jgi:hypothetical protein